MTMSVRERDGRVERRARGRAIRDQAPRQAHGGWSAPAGRADPVEVLEADAADRLARLLPIRRWRMAQSPFAFLRGSADVMARDLAHTPRTGLTVQACGDAHLSNFGVFGTPERRLLFDVNDFDETLQGPWEWDVKRLAASVTVAAREIGSSAGEQRGATLRALAAYRVKLAEYAQMSPAEVWYSRIDEDVLAGLIATKAGRKKLKEGAAKARRRTGDQIAGKIVERGPDGLRISSQPPLILPVGDDPGVMERVGDLLGRYAATVSTDRRLLLSRYSPRDAALKVVGVGSVGTRCWIVLMATDDDEVLLLQVKEAGASVLEGPLGAHSHINAGQRVVEGQRATQAASDAFLGWMRDDDGRDYYVRQLRDMKLSADVATMSPAALSDYAGLCGWALARGHARTGDPAVISGYLGSGRRFDRAVADFARDYADQVERDHASLVEAIASGRLEATEG
jgi:uncharacterized protein (DUF2252 family)